MTSPSPGPGSCANSPILHVFVVGFHHRKGCQIEYCYPPLEAAEEQAEHGAPLEDTSDPSVLKPNGEVFLPDQWSHLPSLALPDGVHNVNKDSVFFHLPPREPSGSTVYGVSCFRQIPSETLVERSSEVTRPTVQKSVCVLASLPLYGLIRAKLEMITEAYFNERNFANVELLRQMYHNLTDTVSHKSIQSQALLGLSCKDLILLLRHKTLILFKLLLLEKRVVINLFPVQKLCEAILTLVSLFPSMIERGLGECAFYIPSTRLVNQLPFSPVSPHETPSADSPEMASFLETKVNSSEQVEAEREPKVESEDSRSSPNRPQNDTLPEDLDAATTETTATPALEEPPTENSFARLILSTSMSKISSWRQKLASPLNSPNGPPAPEKFSGGPEAKEEESGELKSYSTLETDEVGFPLSLFTKGNLCHPYLSLSYIDLLRDNSVRGYLFGATNELFRQRKRLVDAALWENGDGIHLDIVDPELRRQLVLTTADLRFMDYLLKHIYEGTGNVFVDNTEWEGGDEWIRLQFEAYLLSMLKTAKSNDTLKEEDFNESYMTAWKTSHNYRIWACSHLPEVKRIIPGHPFHGQMSITDVKLRLAHTLQSSDSGRKLNVAVASAERYVAQTGKAMEGALLNAKSAMSSWWFGPPASVQLASPDQAPPPDNPIGQSASINNNRPPAPAPLASTGGQA